MEPELRSCSLALQLGMALSVSILFLEDFSVISQMFCYLTGEIYTLLKGNKCFPPLLLPAGPTNDSGRASGGELPGTFIPTCLQLLGATAETAQITLLSQ